MEHFKQVDSKTEIRLENDRIVIIDKDTDRGPKTITKIIVVDPSGLERCYLWRRTKKFKYLINLE